MSIEWDKSLGVVSWNLVPFKTIIYQLSNIKNLWSIRNFIGNIAGFIIFSILGAPVVKKKYLIFFIGMILSLSIEFSQLIFQVGYFDIDDIILNIIGTTMGYFLSSLFRLFYRYDT